MTADRNAVEVERTALAAPNQKGNTMQHYRGKKAAFLKSVRVTYAIAPAADKIGVHRCTVHRWMQADPGFAEAVEDARQAAIDDIEAIHFEKARDRDTLARIHILRSRRGNIYGDRKVSGECQPWQPEPLSPAQMEKSLKAMLDVFRDEGLFAKPVDAAIVPDSEPHSVPPPQLPAADKPR